MSLGDLYDPLGAHLDDPYPIYARARREEPIFYSPPIGAWMVTKMADVRRIMRDGETFSSANALRPFTPFAPAVQEILATGQPQRQAFITMDGEAHRGQRALPAAYLSAARVEATGPYIAERAELLIDGFGKGGPVDFMAAFANRLPVDVVARIVGFAEEDAATFGYDSREAASIGMGHRWRSEQEMIDSAHAFVRFTDMIARYVTRHAPRDDLIGVCRDAYGLDGREPTPEEMSGLIGLVFGVALPGHITTSALLGNALLRLLSVPERWWTLCDRPDLIPTAAHELARYDTPTHTFLRVMTRDARVGGHAFPAGTELAVCLASANRDEEVFDRAEELDLTRKPGPTVVFGYGAHYCLGAALAMRQIETALRLLTERLPGLRLVPDQPIEYRGTLDHRGPRTLLVEC